MGTFEQMVRNVGRVEAIDAQRGASNCNWRLTQGELTQLAPNVGRVEANYAQRGTGGCNWFPTWDELKQWAHNVGRLEASDAQTWGKRQPLAPNVERADTLTLNMFHPVKYQRVVKWVRVNCTGYSRVRVISVCGIIA